ncbi:hypothetical protein N9023_00045 [Opitutaceae bacterium]|nr:hypothetical protein [Opitutaceae bacterium]
MAAVCLSWFEPERSENTSRDIGGFRAFAADVKWIAAYQAWQNRDETRMKQELAWATRLAPGNVIYWLEGARMLGYDVAAWRRGDLVEADDISQINQTAFELARAHLSAGEVCHPERAALPIEEAVMQLRLVGNVASAEQALARAQQCADAPYFVARVRAELLIKLGREREALTLLESEIERLPRSDPRALVDVVEQRIMDLRLRLGEAG